MFDYNINVDKNYILNYIEDKFPNPVLKTWEPDDFYLQHYTKKKLEKTKQKRNEEYLKEYNNILNKKNYILDIINRISNLPKEINNLFYKTLFFMVEDGIIARRKYSECETQLRQKYSNEKNQCIILSYYDTILKSIKEKYNDTTKKCDYYIVDSSKDYILKLYPNIVNLNIKELSDELLNYRNLKNKAVDSLSPQDALYNGCSKLENIMLSIFKIFNGYPQKCTIEPNWGVGGYFNGILESNGIKASFKSFVAGGWNIQRIHIRFRITELKK